MLIHFCVTGGQEILCHSPQNIKLYKTVKTIISVLRKSTVGLQQTKKWLLIKTTELSVRIA